MFRTRPALRSASVKRARPQEQQATTTKRARSSALTSRRSLSPRRDHPRGTSTVARPSQASPEQAENRPVHAQDLEIFKADMTSMLADMLKSSLSDFASQLKPSSGGQGDAVSTQNVASDIEKEPSVHDNRSERGYSASDEDPIVTPGDPKLENPMMTEEEEKDFETFVLASPMVSKRESSWRASKENTKFYSQAQVHHQNDSFTSQARPLVSQALARDQVEQAQGQAQPLLDRAQASVQDQPVSQAQFPVLLAQGQGRPPPVLIRCGDLDSLYGEENFSFDLDNEAALREKQARSEALGRVAEFCKLDRQDPEAKREIMGMRLPVYNAPARKSIEVSLPWHSSTIRIAERNHDIVLGKLNKSMKAQHPARPWGLKEFFTGLGYYTHNTEGYVPKRESLIIPSMPPPAERTAEVQPFFHVPRNP